MTHNQFKFGKIRFKTNELINQKVMYVSFIFINLQELTF